MNESLDIGGVGKSRLRKRIRKTGRNVPSKALTLSHQIGIGEYWSKT
jgi:hypothetical protein